MANASGNKWVWPAVRLAVSAAVVAFIVSQVPWRSRARLADGRWLAVVERADDEGGLYVRDAGERRFVRFEQLAQDEGREGPEPAIETGLREVSGSIRWPWMGAALAAFAAVPAFQAARWRRLLAVQNVRLSAGTTLRLMWIGLFFNLFLLGAVGGDLVKAYYVTKHSSARAESMITVLVDRLIGLLGLLWLSALAIVLWLILGAQQIPGGMPWAWLTPGAVVLAGGAAFYSRRLRRLLGIDRLMGRLREGHVLRRLDRAVYLYRHHKAAIGAAFGWTFASHVCLLGCVYFASQAMRTGAPLLHVVVFAPLIFVGSGLIPSVGGLGVQEFAFILFFSRLGFGTRAASLALALLVRLTQVVVSLPGAALLALGAHLPSRAEMERQVQEAAP